ncbi:Lrp/AsnC family leucine-responsive transcriptional regulator [Paenibacillus cellulosilyticus]|uniref:Lrp/AsnC family leucine-responsive transcriptional regulator n=1 Tax=Paenibacillus cellulosilyticus TaxID=375489 RepID=A0A2V2YVA3_9BACL|nr:Lrp/AsnC family transcriptional regulator [Paenibacillus cellulosilyticus]PWW05157.1 Lrp/AsnC family leucine-responsive transcriptional regulator [Paenibacillus cellulosilyticus]
MANQTIDDTDIRILQALLNDALLTHKEIGELVHLTGQAVGARVRKLQDLGVIEGYTLRWNPERIGLSVHAFLILFLNSNQAHQALRELVQSSEAIQEMHRVSGEGCYWLRVRVSDMTELNKLLEAILTFGNYKLSMSIEQIK